MSSFFSKIASPYFPTQFKPEGAEREKTAYFGKASVDRLVDGISPAGGLRRDWDWESDGSFLIFPLDVQASRQSFICGFGR